MRSDWMRSVHESRSNVNTPDGVEAIVQAPVCALSRSTARTNASDVVLKAGGLPAARILSDQRPGPDGLSTDQTPSVDRRDSADPVS